MNEPGAQARVSTLPPGETQVLRTRPAFLFVLLYRQFWWLAPVATFFVVHAIAARIWTPDPMPWLVWLAIAWLLLGFAWRICTWLARAYILTDQRIIVRTGIFRVTGADIPLRRIQHTTIDRSFLEQIFNLGTIGVATAGDTGPVINLLMVPNPNQVLAAIQETARRAPARQSASQPLVIGLAGGIGSGKSEVARILASLGCMVVDSDKDAKEALDRPEVRDQLVSWWGRGILDPSGRVARKAVSDIVFKGGSDKDRAALEALIHPILRSRRADLREQAQAVGARAAVIDAPLLFEAGVDAECDAVMFVDAPRDLRLARIKASRGWDEAELIRRESAQLPVEEKRRRSTVVVFNNGSLEALRPRVEIALRKLTTTAKTRS